MLTSLDASTLVTGDDIEENIPAFILGDSAYRNTRHFVTTYKVTECNNDRSIRRLNFRLSRARYHVEHAFGLLKGRFQILSKPVKSAGEDLPFAVYLLGSIFVLHNFLIDAHDSVAETEILPTQIASQVQALRNIDVDRHGPGSEQLSLESNGQTDEESGALEVIDDGPPTRDILLRHIKWLEE